MELSELSRNQTRLQFLQSLLDNNEVTDEETRLKLVDTMKTYRNLIARCWETQTISEEDKTELANLDRKLEALHEDSRVRMSI